MKELYRLVFIIFIIPGVLITCQYDELIESGENAILAVNPGQEYIIYDEDGGEIEVNLTDANGTMTASWYDPRSGEFMRSRSITGGQTIKFTAPDNNNDWVLHIHLEQ